MMGQHTFFPKWNAAKRALLEGLELHPQQMKILNDWLEKHMFEFNVDVTTTYRPENLSPDEVRQIEAYDTLKAGRVLGEGIIRTKMFHVVHNKLEFKNVMRITVLLCGVPDLVRTKEGKLIPVGINL